MTDSGLWFIYIPHISVSLMAVYNSFSRVRADVTELVKAPLAAAISSCLISLTQLTHVCERMTDQYTGGLPPTLHEQCVRVLYRPIVLINRKGCKTGAYSLKSLSEKT